MAAGEPHLGIPQDRRRAGRPGPPGRRLHGLGDPEEGQDRPDTPPLGPNLDGVYCMVVMEISTRRVHVLGITANPTGIWAVQQTRDLPMTLDNRVDQVKFLTRDRDAKFTDAFDAVFASEGTHVLLSPFRTPRANAFIERWIGGCRRELLDRPSSSMNDTYLTSWPSTKHTSTLIDRTGPSPTQHRCDHSRTQSARGQGHPP